MYRWTPSQTEYKGTCRTSILNCSNLPVDIRDFTCEGFGSPLNVKFDSTITNLVTMEANFPNFPYSSILHFIVHHYNVDKGQCERIFLDPLPFQSRGFFDLLTLRSPRTLLFRFFLRNEATNLTKVLKATSLFRIEYAGDSKLQKCLTQHRIDCILVFFLTVHHAFSSVRTYTLVSHSK